MGQKNKNIVELVEKIGNILKDLSERVRVLEERVEQISKEIIEINKSIRVLKNYVDNNVDKLNERFYDSLSRIEKLEENVKSIQKNMSKFARREDLLEIKNYLLLLKPLYALTEYDVRKIVREEVDKLLLSGEKWLKKR